MASSAAIEQRNQDATCYCGGLDEQVTDELLWELMTNAGPVVHVHIPRDKVTGNHQAFGFVEFRSEEDAEYACKVRLAWFCVGLRVGCVGRRLSPIILTPRFLPPTPTTQRRRLR